MNKDFNPKQGDKILVSVNKEKWYERTFVILNKNNTYACICNDDDGKWLLDSTYGVRTIRTRNWKYAKPLKT